MLKSVQSKVKKNLNKEILVVQLNMYRKKSQKSPINYTCQNNVIVKNEVLIYVTISLKYSNI